MEGRLNWPQHFLQEEVEEFALFLKRQVEQTISSPH
jgi:hypothetical protein